MGIFDSIGGLFGNFLPDIGLGSLLGIDTGAAAGGALLGAAGGAGIAGLTGGNPLQGAVGGAITGGLLPSLGGTSGYLSGQIGETAADALTGAFGSTLGAAFTGSNNLGGAALAGGAIGGLGGALNSSGAFSGLFGNDASDYGKYSGEQNYRDGDFAPSAANSPTSVKTDWSQFTKDPSGTLLSAAKNNAQYAIGPAINVASSLLRGNQTNPYAAQVAPVAAPPQVTATQQNTPMQYGGLPPYMLDYARYQGNIQ